MSIADRLIALGLTLPERVQPPPGARLPFAAVHARSAIGVAELPWGIPVEVEAEVEIAD